MDLHDQTLADLTRLARGLERHRSREGANEATLEQLQQALQTSIKDLRQIIEQASPSVLQLFGFAEAVENHLERSIRESGTSIKQRLHDTSEGMVDRMDQTVRIALFRIVQEAINNAVRHADATNVCVRISCRSGTACVAVSDDGEASVQLKPRIGGGLENMKTRARLISAALTITRRPDGKGTVVRVSLPFVQWTPTAAAERAMERV
jgi:signal transduction histidine kinase